MGFDLEVDLVLEKETSLGLCLGLCLGTGMGFSTAPRMVPLREVAMEFGPAWHWDLWMDLGLDLEKETNLGLCLGTGMGIRKGTRSGSRMGIY